MTEQQAACMQIRVGIRALQAILDEEKLNSADSTSYAFSKAKEGIQDIGDGLNTYETYMGVSHD